MPISEEIKNFNYLISATEATLGYYAPCGNKATTQWISCREVFQSSFENTKHFFWFAAKHSELNAISSFLDHMERVSTQNAFTLCGKTNKENVVWIAPSHFWSSCELRWNLFTLLLRISRTYDPVKHNVQECIEKNSYTSQTKPALDRFTFGFSQYKGRPLQRHTFAITDGWASFFSHQKLNQVRDLLISA